MKNKGTLIAVHLHIVLKGEIMKIENFALELSSQHTKTKKVTTTFEEEFNVQNKNREVTLDRVKDELEFTKRFKYQMLHQFIFSLRSVGRIEPRELTTRTVKIEREIYEHEKLDVQMKGCVQTGTQKIEIDMDISFSSTFMQKHQLLKTQFYDPLVLNFDGELPDLDTQSFSFDIDCDGESDQISMLKSGNGFLALDKNENGIIDDGTELFGTQNGHGFYDLRRYDSDNNGWIDENDPILDSLRIWDKNADEDRLLALGEIGIGALYLGFTQNSFDIKNEENDTLGRIRLNGLFLNEDGSSGIISQIDFAKISEEIRKEDSEVGLTDLLRIS